MICQALNALCTLTHLIANFYLVPATVLKASHVLTDLVLPAPLWDKYCYHPHFTDEETKLRAMKWLAQNDALVNGSQDSNSDKW